MSLTLEESFRIYLKSGFPIITIPTREVDRVTAALLANLNKWNDALPKMRLPEDKEHLKINGYQGYRWDCVNGWRHTGTKDVIPNTNKTPHDGLKWLIEDKAPPGIYIMENAHMFYGDTYTLPELVQLFREHYAKGKMHNRHLFLVGDSTELPSELEPLTVVIDFPLPTREELEAYVGDYVETLGLKLPKKITDRAADAATGMTTHEVESAVCVALVKSKGKDIDKEIVFSEKAKAVKRSGLLEFIPTDFDFEHHIGGLENFKDWLRKVAAAYKDFEGAREYGLPVPKGCLVAGISGTGKSAAAKATANLFGVPLFRLDIGRVFGGLVGETERKTRQLIQLMEAVAPCVVLLDEVEKALAGLGSSDATDSGVTARLMGNLLYWLQEKNAPVYIMATANEVGKLPPEMLRKGRFDELWFVDLPSEEERVAILRIHIERTGRDIRKFKGFEKLAGQPTLGYTGAELEAIVKQAMFDAFSDGQREFTLDDIAKAIDQTVPLIKTKAKEIADLRKWADNKARKANIGESVRVAAIPTKKSSSIFIDDGDAVQALGKRERARRARRPSDG